MGFTFDSGGVTVSVSASPSGIAIPSATQTVVTVKATGNGSSQDAYTVTTGKTFYLYGLLVRGVSASCIVYANDGTTEKCSLETGATNANSASVSSAVPIGVWTTGQIVKVTCSNTKVYTFWGIEQ